jgi:uncharacterized protein (UPF0548 family)/ligand-binding SRPBCC domain-containing protein
MARTFQLVTRAAVSRERLFDLSLDIDAHVASMAGSGERAIAGVTRGRIGLGETVTWRARHLGIWFRMTSKIMRLERPAFFVDEQVRGPFRAFRHEHRFTADDDGTGVGGTVMIDTLTIASPVFGRLAEDLVLVPYLRRLIRERNHALLRALGADRGTEPAREGWRPDPASPWRRSEISAVVGRGDEAFRRAVADVLSWRVKTRSGFRIDDESRVTPGARRTVTARVGGVRILEPVEVAAVVDTPSRAGFSYRTLPGHPLTGEEAFIVHRAQDDVILTVRSLTAPAPRGGWRYVYPILLLAQRVVRRRYLRALRDRPPGAS